MDANGFRIVRQLFDAAIDLEPESRDAFLAERCTGDAALRKKVERLLAARDRKAPALDLDGPPVARSREFPLSGQVIGGYKIVREIGHGGMGTVFLGERADGAFQRLAAIKILRYAAATQEFVDRFRQERQILALLDHPNIARLFEGGTTSEGLPYFVMEYVAGEPITEYCDHRRLSVSARLRLFETVCSACNTHIRS